MTLEELVSVRKTESADDSKKQKLRSRLAYFCEQKRYAKRLYEGESNYSVFVDACIVELERREKEG